MPPTRDLSNMPVPGAPARRYRTNGPGAGGARVSQTHPIVPHQRPSASRGRSYCSAHARPVSSRDVGGTAFLLRHDVVDFEEYRLLADHALIVRAPLRLDLDRLGKVHRASRILAIVEGTKGVVSLWGRA